MPWRPPIPNEFTIEPIIEVAGETADGTKVFRQMNPREYREWQREGGDLEDLVDEDDA